MQKVRSALLTVLVLAPLSDAVSFLAPQHGPAQASLLASAQKKEMPITQHKKEAGGLYKEGSPLYEKQQKQGKEGPPEAAPPPSKDGKDGEVLTVTHPPEDKATDPYYYYKMQPYKPFSFAWWRHGLFYFLSYVLFCVLFGAIWVQFGKRWGRLEVSWDERENKGTRFAYDLFSCHHCFDHHGLLCFCTWCCAPLRVADTYSKEPSPLVKGFWMALIMLAVIGGLHQLTFGFSQFVFLCVAVYFRQQLRKKYFIESGGFTVCADFFSWCCCPFCTIAQEARQVDFVDPTKFRKG